MQVTRKILRHPSKPALLAYAENLVDNHGAIDGAMASHISQCPACNAEVRAMQASLSFVDTAPELDPGKDLTAQILMAGKQVRSDMKRQATPWRTACRFAQAGACAAAMVLVMGLTFTAFLSSPESEMSSPVFDRAVPVIAGGAASPEAARAAAVEMAAEVQTLSAAIQSKQGEAQTPLEREQMRVVQARDDDTAAAMQALERNPHNVRATHVVHANLKSLRSIYVEGGSL